MLQAISMQGVDYYSLLPDDAKDNLPSWIHPREYTDPWEEERPALDPWIITMNLIDSMDVVITTCTSIAHLAGAMGKETWLMVSRPCYFLWPREGSVTPLYPSMRIFRQHTPGDWDSCLRDVFNELGDRS